MHHLVKEAGLTWTGTADSVKNTGVCQVSIERPDTHELVPKMVLFAFDDTPVEGGATGATTWASSGSPRPSLRTKPLRSNPTCRSPKSKRRLTRAVRRKWTLYAMMPVDNAELFAGMDDAERQKLLPKSALSRNSPTKAARSAITNTSFTNTRSIAN